MIGSILGGRYRVDSLIGAGGMANVYKAYDEVEKRTVAVKMLKKEHQNDAEFVRRFAREAQAVLSLSHPNIVASYAVGNDEETGLPYIILEYVEGGTLKELIQKRGPLSPKTAINIACQVLDALQYAHTRGIIHRDVKPQNVMITPRGKAKLADFGIARDAAATTRTFAGTNVIGSVHYISPEQAKGDAVSERSDIYSCAIMLYEMLTGQVPFAGDNSVAIALKHLQEEIIPPIQVNPRIPRALSDVIVKGAAKDPSLRYISAEEMRLDLIRALREPHGKFARIVQPSTEKRRKASSSLGVGTIALAIVVLLGLFGSAFLITQTLRGRNGDRASEYIVPTLTGKTLTEARDLAKLRGFQVSVSNYVASTEYPADQVISQTPDKGTIGQEGDVITVVVSSGNGGLVAPNLLGKTLQEVMLIMAEENLQLGDTTYAISEQPAGQVIRQEPEAGTLLEAEDRINIWVSGTEISGGEMPNLIGLSLSLAVQAAQENGYEQIWVRFVTPDDGAEEEKVQRQNPPATLQTSGDTRVELWVNRSYLGDYAADIAINLDIDQEEQPVVVTAQMSNGAEVVLYETTLGVGKQQPISFTGYLRSEGEYTCIVYVGGTEVRRFTNAFMER